MQKQLTLILLPVLLAVVTWRLADVDTAAHANDATQRKIVLIAGPLDPGHPRGTHEYERSVRLLKHCLDTATNVKGFKTEVHFGGWPADARTLDDAHAIVLIASGSDRREQDHPLLMGDRMEVLGKQMKRGCGLVMIHWCTFVPQAKAGDKVLDWIGGYFDYESGPKPQGWYSKIQTTASDVHLPMPSHPACRGLTDFKLKDEFYYQMRFRAQDPRLTPLLNVALPGEKEPQTVAWCVERQDGGRGVGFTGGHFFDNWQVEALRRFVLNAIVWAARGEVPKEGIISQPPTEQQLAAVSVLSNANNSDSPKLVEGRYGMALDARAGGIRFDGDERFRYPPLTVECWGKLFDPNGFNVMVANDLKSSARHWELYSYAGSGNLSAYLPGMEPSEIISDVSVCDGQWHYYAMTYDAHEVRLFVDGKKVKQQAIRPKVGMQAEPGPLTIGLTLAADHRVGCNGLVDDVRISNVIRDVSAMPSAPLTHDPLTVGLWHLDKPEGVLDAAWMAAWTPPPQDEKAEPWERETDVNWVDARLREMDTGPTFNATFEYPSWKGKTKVFKGTAIKVGNGGMLFDRNQLRWAAGWTGGFLNHSDRRFGLLNTPTPAGKIVFATNDGPGWSKSETEWVKWPTPTAPLPREWGRFDFYQIVTNDSGKDQVVLFYQLGNDRVEEVLGELKHQDLTVLTRFIDVTSSGPNTPIQPRRCLITELPGEPRWQSVEGTKIVVAEHAGLAHAVAIKSKETELELVNQRVEAKLPAVNWHTVFQVYLWSGLPQDLPKFVGAINRDRALLTLKARSGPPRWGSALVTKGETAPNDAPYVVDTLTVPYDNPYKAMMFLSGVDFLPNGDAAVCTVHGDVWIVSGIDERLENLKWKRFATGLYQPLGLKVVNGDIFVLERGQLTRLHRGSTGEADVYENFNNDWHTGAGEHSYDTCLETDPQGNFYFFKTGDPETPTGGCLIRVSADGKKSEIVATGFRHPIGLGVSPDGVVSGADQEGNFMPSTRVDLYRQGGFYGDMRTHHRKEPPKIYDPPLLWLPREADNSAGGQVWVTSDRFGPLKGKMLHLSYGRCRVLEVLPQKVGEVQQAGAVDLGLFFLSGVMRGRFRPQDGQLYVAGLRGWQTAARRDGCLQRVRYTGQQSTLPLDMSIHEHAIRLKFSQPLDKAIATDVKHYVIEQWNYRWSADYGSKHWSVSDPNKLGHDSVKVQAAEVSADGMSVTLRIDPLRPVMQMRINYELKTSSGQPFVGKVFNTIHAIPPD